MRLQFPVRLRFPVRLSLVVALSVVGLAACSAQGTPTGYPTEPDTVGIEESPAATPAVSLACAPNTLITSTLDVDTAPAQETTNDAVVTCTYQSPTGGGSTVIVRVSADEDAASFARARKGVDESGNPTTKVTGLADEAYYSSVEFGDIVTNTLVARKGTVSIQVIAVASVDAEKALIDKLFATLT